MNKTLKQKIMSFLTPRRQRLAGRIMYGVGICLMVAVQAHAQTDPFTTTAQSWETMLTGTFAQAIAVSGIVLAGAPVALGHAGNHKNTLTGVAIGCTVVLAAQRIVSSLIAQ